jgi:hypothetical protein
MIETSSVLPEPDRIAAGARELVGLVYKHLPQRFYSKEKWSSLYAAASLVHMAETVESLMVLLPARRDDAALVLIRSLYEQTVTFLWVASDPPTHYRRWAEDSNWYSLRMHNDMVKFVGEGFLTEGAVGRAKKARRMPSLIERAVQADEAWKDLRGMYQAGHPLSLRGQYMLLYRSGSNVAHGSLPGLEPYVSFVGNRYVVQRARETTLVWYALASPLLATALVVAARTFFKWLDEDEVRTLNERAVATGGLAP